MNLIKFGQHINQYLDNLLKEKNISKDSLEEAEYAKLRGHYYDFIISHPDRMDEFVLKKKNKTKTGYLYYLSSDDIPRLESFLNDNAKSIEVLSKAYRSKNPKNQPQRINYQPVLDQSANNENTSNNSHSIATKHMFSKIDNLSKQVSELQGQIELLVGNLSDMRKDEKKQGTTVRKILNELANNTPDHEMSEYILNNIQQLKLNIGKSAKEFFAKSRGYSPVKHLNKTTGQYVTQYYPDVESDVVGFILEEAKHSFDMSRRNNSRHN